MGWVPVDAIQGLGAGDVWTPVGSVRGPAGPPGIGGALVHVQSTPAATWTIPHGFARIPHSVTVYIGGQQVLIDATVDATYVVLEFPSPESGEVHIL